MNKYTNAYDETNKILRKYGIKADKRLGQNFLISDFALESIIESVEINENDLVIEIGPGLGNLTEYILRKTKNVLLVEIDEKMLEILKDRFESKIVNEILNKDILKLDIDKYIEELELNNGTKYTDVKVIANLPYYITTPILFKLLEESKRVSSIVVMIQKEVAYRISSQEGTKDYGVLTIMINAYADTKLIIDVGREMFLPAPNVDSAVILIEKKEKYSIKDKVKFRELVSKSFANRRKKMVNSLEINGFLGKTKQELIEILKNNGIDETKRAEQISIEKYVQLSNNV